MIIINYFINIIFINYNYTPISVLGEISYKSPTTTTTLCFLGCHIDLLPPTSQGKVKALFFFLVSFKGGN